LITWPHPKRTTRLGRRLDVWIRIAFVVWVILPGAASALPVRDADADRRAAHALVVEGQRQLATGTYDGLRSAIDALERAHSIWCSLRDEPMQAATLGMVGRAYELLGDDRQALACYVETCQLARRLGDRRAEAVMLNNIGLVHDALGERRTALEYYAKALPALREVGDRRSEAATLVNTGLAFDNLGERQKAVAYYRDALELLRAVGDRRGEAATLNNLGYVYDGLGARDQAMAYFEQALRALDGASDARLEAVTLNNIGYLHGSSGDPTRAAEYYGRSLPLLVAAGDRRLEAVTRNNLGLVHLGAGAVDEAKKSFLDALELRRAVGDRTGEAVTLADLGDVEAIRGHRDEARDLFRRSIEMSRDVEDVRTEASTLHRLAREEVKAGNLAEARARLEAALSLVEHLRSRLASHDLRSSYFASVHRYFETYVDVLMRQHRADPRAGHDAEALAASERARARSLLEVLGEARADIRKGVSPALVARERALTARLNAAAERNARLGVNAQGPPQPFAREIAGLLAQLEEVDADIRQESPQYAALTRPRPLGASEIQKLLDPDTVLLEYALGQERSVVWVVTARGLRSVEIAARSRIENATREAYGLLTARNERVRFETPQERRTRVAKADAEFPRSARRLADLVLAPVGSLSGAKRIVVVPDGALNYVPFSALPSPVRSGDAADDYRPLVEDVEIVSLPSASTLAAIRQETAGRARATKTLAVVADPVFDVDDERVTRRRAPRARAAFERRGATRTRSAAPDDPPVEEHRPAGDLAEPRGPYARLPFTRTEADRILALVPENARLRAVDFDANLEGVTGGVLGDYRYVHFATHGVLDSRDPELSGIVLSLVDESGAQRAGFLWAHEVFNLKLSADLVVLSGCRTGLGKEIRGEGLVGLTRGFLYAGAERVLVSLWDVSDEASAELMAQMYGSLLGKREGPAEALRSAQLAVRAHERWRAPYYWAVFVLQGEVR
jgi:CHAT domain-containing protein/Tfp pilus assembly protein PilF